ncbi:MAG: FAD-containing oxidoreductase, partial [Verrucomicrobia bacterium]|nr:FAD-containing oxidoreductase [Verrucomicrobiota bacterium]
PTETFITPFDKVDRALTDGDTDGFVKIVARKGSGAILGGTIVGRHAGELISEVSAAMAGNLTLSRLAGVIHPYPTRADAIRKCGDLFNKGRLTDRARSVFTTWLRWRRGR